MTNEKKSIKNKWKIKKKTLREMSLETNTQECHVMPIF